VPISHFDAMRQRSPVDRLVIAQVNFAWVIVLGNRHLKAEQPGIVESEVPTILDGAMLAQDDLRIDPRRRQRTRRSTVHRRRIERLMSAMTETALEPLGAAGQETMVVVEGHQQAA